MSPATLSAEPSSRTIAREVAIYPDVTQDGIGTYIRGLRSRLGVESIPSRSHILSPRQMLSGLPAGYKLIHVPNFMVPLTLSRTKVLCTIQDIIPLQLPDTPPLHKAYLRLRVWLSLKRSHHVIFTSQATRAAVEREFGWVPAHSIIPLACDEAVPEADIPQRPYPFPYFLHVGRRRAHKNAKGILRAFAAADPAGEHRLVFGGKKDVDDEVLLELATSLGVAGRVLFSGFLTREQLAAHYRHATAFVFPSLLEGFGIPILEAMSYGCPVITSSLSSMPEVAGDAALLVDPGDPESIGKAMVSVIRDGELRSRLGRLGYLNVAKFGWDCVAESTLRVYRSMGADVPERGGD